MSGLDLFPMPEGAPEAGACIRVDRPEPGLAVLSLVPPHRSLAVLDAPLLRDFEAALNALEADKDLEGLVVAGADPLKFAAGADLEAIRTMDKATDVEEVVRVVHDLFLRLEGLSARTVAAVGGPVPGGAFELALSCDAIVIADHPSTRIGLPEVKLGLIPGWGGCHRLPERVGISAALGMILKGSLVPAKPALKRGMVDRLTDPEYLVKVASDLAMGREPIKPRKAGVSRWLVDLNPLGRFLVGRLARKQVMARTLGKYPAALDAVALVAGAPGRSRKAAAKIESTTIAGLAVGPECKALVKVFFGMEAAKKRFRGAGREGGIRRAGVLGAGVMGGGLARLMAEKGLETRLFDPVPEALDRTLLTHRNHVEGLRRRHRLKRHQALAATDRLQAAREATGFGRSQVILEAVAEDLAIKQKALLGMAEQVSEDCILATNTSSLSVTAIANGLPHPERVVGMHFFNPVHKMPLVEVVRGEETSEETAAETAALALALGKTPVVVRDVPGFLVNRILGPYLDEAVHLFAAGADPARIDRLLLDFGMPMGPFRLLDEVGLDIASHVSKILHAAYGDRMSPATAIPAMVTSDRLGKKTGQGFYQHPAAKGRSSLCRDLSRFQLGQACATLEDADIVDRLVLLMVNEGWRCLEEGVVGSEEELDLATVLGTGFAPFRGGLMSHARTMGEDRVRDRLAEFAEAADVTTRTGGPDRYTPAR